MGYGEVAAVATNAVTHRSKLSPISNFADIFAGMFYNRLRNANLLLLRTHKVTMCRLPCTSSAPICQR
jgi:hypothetical protein